MGFGRIISAGNLTSILTIEQAEAASKLINKLLEAGAHLVFGIFTNSGEAIDFTSKKKTGDTHVALLLGPEAMAALDPINASLKKDAYQESDKSKAQGNLIKQLEAELRSLRSKENG